MEQSLTDIDPNQVKSISVLKDAASASLYGSRGANGVIIIETKRGVTDQFKVDIHSWTAISDPIDLPEFVGSADYMRLNNEARTMQGQSPLLPKNRSGLPTGVNTPIGTGSMRSWNAVRCRTTPLQVYPVVAGWEPST